jgi:hypothetical protein
MIKVTTKTGFEAEVNENKISDIRFWKKYKALTSNEVEDSNKLNACIDMIGMILSEKDEERLYEHVAGHHGGVAETNYVIEEFSGILEKCAQENNKVKNS